MRKLNLLINSLHLFSRNSIKISFINRNEPVDFKSKYCNIIEVGTQRVTKLYNKG